jgi:transposase-like protein
MAVIIVGRRFWLWRSVDDEGGSSICLCDHSVIKNRLKKQGFAPDVVVIDKLRSLVGQKVKIGLSAGHERGLRKNNRAENSHHPTRRRERKPTGSV